MMFNSVRYGVNLRVLALGWVCSLVGFGCEREGPVPHSPSEITVATSDRAGVSIVESYGSQSPKTSVTEAEPGPLRDSSMMVPELVEPHVLEIGAVSGEVPYLFDNIVNAVRLSNGTIVVANAGTRELRFFDSSGRFLYAQGRQGEGPGEYRTLTGLWRMGGDTLVAYDRSLGRMTVVSP